MDNENLLDNELKLRPRRHGLGAELFYLARKSRKYWLIPFILMLLLFGAFMFLAGTGAAPFIYTLF